MMHRWGKNVVVVVGAACSFLRPFCFVIFSMTDEPMRNEGGKNRVCKKREVEGCVTTKT